MRRTPASAPPFLASSWSAGRRRHPMRYAALIVPLVALLALACKGGGGPASTPAAAPASPPPPATAPPAATATATPVVGAPAEVQAVIDAALSGDPQQLLPLVGY